jgi:hypothetical protein
MLIFISQIVVLLLGVTIVVFAGWGISSPEKLMTFATTTLDQRWGIYIAVIVRLILGAAMIGVAPASSFPIAFQTLGWITIAAAVALAVAGRERVRGFLAWWTKRFSASTNRLWLLFGIGFGAFLVFGVL